MLYPTRNHPSRFHHQRIVYPVVSRRAGGVSIGVNLSPSKRCNFGCVYCQVHVDRTRDAELLAQVSPLVDLSLLESELRATVETVESGSLFSEPRFAETPAEKRFLKDFAFSGDGEPTLSPQFPEAVEILARVRKEKRLDALKLVLITNATNLRNERTVDGCDLLAKNGGEVWVKLDGGSPEHYRRMNRSSVPFETILDHIAFAARRWPTAIQTMFLAEAGISPSDREVADYCRTIRELLASGERGAQAGRVSRIQLYTVARPPVENDVSPLDNATMDALAKRVHEETGVSVEVFYSK